MNNLISFSRKHVFLFICIFIFVIGTFLRLYHFPERVALGVDDARDISVAKEALRIHTIPLIGSFSSAGPFVFGPIYIWIIMLSFVLLPFTFYAPWIVTALVGLMTIGILSYIGGRLGGKSVAIISACVASFSPQLIAHSIILMQHSYVALCASLSFLFYVLLWQEKKVKWALLLGVSIGASICFHYESLNLLLFLLAILFLPIEIRSKLLRLGVSITGVVLPLLPLFIWDIQQNFANLRNLLDYFLIGEYRLYVPNSWKLFLFHYLPQLWAFVSGGNVWIAYLQILILFVGIGSAVYKKKVRKLDLSLVIVFVLLLILNRYYRGERSESYLLYFVPFVIVLFSLYLRNTFIFLQEKLQNFSFVFLFLVLLAIVFGDLSTVVPFSYSSSVQNAKGIAAMLLHRYPHKKFTLFDYHSLTVDDSEALSVVMASENLTDKNGIQIGVMRFTKMKIPYKIVLMTGNIQAVDLRPLKIRHSTNDWEDVNQEGIYDTLIGWSNKHVLTSSFNIVSYARSKI